MANTRNNRHQLNIGQVAERTGLSVSAIRFYEEKGLVFPARSKGGQRLFVPADIRRLSFVLIAQKLGFSIAEIAEQLAFLPAHKAPSKKDWTRISGRFSRVLDARIAALIRLKENLDGCIGCGCLSLEKCALYNPDDVAAREGAGPRFLLAEREHGKGRETDVSRE